MKKASKQPSAKTVRSVRASLLLKAGKGRVRADRVVARPDRPVIMGKGKAVLGNRTPRKSG